MKAWHRHLVLCERARRERQGHRWVRRHYSTSAYGGVEFHYMFCSRCGAFCKDGDTFFKPCEAWETKPQFIVE